jgi:Fe-S cluster assembly iron-binding protein IscA
MYRVEPVHPAGAPRTNQRVFPPWYEAGGIDVSGVVLGVSGLAMPSSTRKRRCCSESSRRCDEVASARPAVRRREAWGAHVAEVGGWWPAMTARVTWMTGNPAATSCRIHVSRVTGEVRGQDGRISDRKAIRIVLTITTEAAQAINAIVGSSPMPQGGLKISAKPVTDSESTLELSVVESPAENDQVIEDQGTRVFLEQLASDYLEDKVLDAEVEGEQIRFTLQDQGPGPTPRGAPEQN